MHPRAFDTPSPASSSFPDIVLRTPPNWTAVGFVALLAGLHLSVAGRAFLAGRWEGYVSLLFGTLLAAAAVVLFRVRTEVAVLYRHGQLRVRTGVGRWSARQCIPFGAVRAVRVTLGPRGSSRDSVVELICHLQDVLCPPTTVPRQLGLLLAMMIGVPLVKVSKEDEPEREQTIREATSAAHPGEPAGR